MIARPRVLLRWLACMALLCGAGPASGAVPRAVDGWLDLRSWDFERQGVVVLQGDWEFCGGELVAPQDPACPATWQPMKVPGLWARAPSQTGISGPGVASYRLRILLPDDGPGLSLRAGAPLTASRLWIDGRAYPGSGTVARGPADAVPQLRNRLHVLPEGRDRLELLVQVSNFDFRSGGLRRRWVLGTHQQVHDWSDALLLRDSIVAAVNLLVGVFFLGFYAFRRQEREKLYFGLVAMALGLRAVPGAYSDLGQLVAPALSFSWILRLEYLANNAVVFGGMGYFLHKIPQVISLRLARPIQAGALLAAGVALVAPLPVVLRSLLWTELLGVAMLAAGWVGLTVAARRGLPNVRLTLLAMPVCLGAVVYDSLRAEGVLDSPVELFPAAMLALVVTEALVLMRSFSRSYTTIETLSKDLLESNRDLRETNEAVERFVPYDFLRLLEKGSIREIRRGDHLETRMHILFCDIRSFTPLVESMPPGEVFRFVNAFLQHMEPAIHDRGGFINHYVGDCIVALFHDSSDDALQAGVDMLDALERFNREERARDAARSPIRVGIGINTGPLMLGTLGGMERLDAGVIGDAVNVASRVESLSKAYGAACLISGTTYQGLSEPGRHELRELDFVVLKGRTEPVPIYEVLAGLDERVRTTKLAQRDRFQEARRAYRSRQFGAAGKLFEECLAGCPEDLACALYAERCRRLAVEGVPPGWRGETVLSAK